ncbi:hypothetical protein Tco_0669586, partial [Tanacetum coccineum]
MMMVDVVWRRWVWQGCRDEGEEVMMVTSGGGVVGDGGVVGVVVS